VFTLDDEIRAARFQRDIAAGNPLAQGHGLHAFVFFSFILAEALKLIIETWTDVHEWRPEVVFLVVITVLSAQYWWVVYESAFFYGRNLFSFACGALETALFYAIAYLLRNFQSLRWPFFLLGAMVTLFVLVDLLKYIENVKKNERTYEHISPRQLLRLIAIVLAFLGGFACISEWVAASVLLMLVLVFTGLTGFARWKAA